MVTGAGEIMMSGNAVSALGLPTSVMEQIKRVRKADEGSEKDIQMHLVPKEILRKFLPSVSAIQAQYDGETQQGRNQQDAGIPNLGAGSSGSGSAMPAATGLPQTFQPPAGPVPAATTSPPDTSSTAPPVQTPEIAKAEAEALLNICTEKDRLIATLQEQIRQSKEAQAQLMQSYLLRPAAPGAPPPPPPPASSGPACTPEGPLPKFKPVPSAAVPKMRSKAPKAPAPQTGCAARRTVILPSLSRLNRAQLENLATQWEVDPRGKTVAQIRDALYDLDKDMREGRRPVPSKST